MKEPINNNPIDYLVFKFKEYDEHQIKLLHREIEISKEIFKEKIIESVYDSLLYESRYCGDYDAVRQDAEEYFNKKYKP